MLGWLANLNFKDMMEYGYIDENGHLRSRFLQPIVYKMKNGTMESTITVDDQIKELGPGWKPVDSVDENKRKSDDDGYVIRLVPYDAGDHIAYDYIKVKDVQAIKKHIIALKQSLTDGDYKIVKCFEANLLGEELPYDMAKLHKDREALRSEINEWEVKL
jgi:hypothetical protein